MAAVKVVDEHRLKEVSFGIADQLFFDLDKCRRVMGQLERCTIGLALEVTGDCGNQRGGDSFGQAAQEGKEN